MNRGIKFTTNALSAIGTKKRVRYRDIGCPGLVLDVTPTGGKTFQFRRRVEGKEHCFKIGTFPEWSVEKARKRAQELGYKLSQGDNPNDRRKALRNSLRVEEFFNKYVEAFEVQIKVGTRRQASLENTLRNWKNHCSTRLEKFRVVELTAIDAGDFLDEIINDSSPSIHNKCLTTLKAVFNFGIRKNIVNYNPFAGFSRFRDKKRERFLSHEELQSFFESLKHESQIYQDVCMTLLLTAQRKSCVLSMKWDEINLHNNIWIIPSTKMKGHRVHSVPLTSTIVEILRRRQAESTGEEFVFPGRSISSGHITDKSGKSGFWKRIVRRAGLDSTEKDKRVVIHDLRRTMASWQANDNVSMQTIAKLLGHTNTTVTSENYAHLSIGTTRKSLDRTAHRMLAVDNRMNIPQSTEDELMELIRNLSGQSQQALLEKLQKQTQFHGW